MTRSAQTPNAVPDIMRPAHRGMRGAGRLKRRSVSLCGSLAFICIHCSTARGMDQVFICLRFILSFLVVFFEQAFERKKLRFS